MAEEPGLDLVPLAGARWEMRHAERKLQLVDKTLKFDLPRRLHAPADRAFS